MSMIPYEVVKRAVHFQGPDRLPMRFSTLGLNDTHSVPPTPSARATMPTAPDL